jgi:hypothetical protein
MLPFQRLDKELYSNVSGLILSAGGHPRRLLNLFAALRCPPYVLPSTFDKTAGREFVHELSVCSKVIERLL